MIGRLLCRLFGHPDDQVFGITMCGDDEPIMVACGRCGQKLVDRMAP